MLAALDEPSDIRVLARGLLVAAPDGRPVFREADLPGERCVYCPTDVPGPNGEQQQTPTRRPPVPAPLPNNLGLRAPTPKARRVKYYF